MPGESKDDLKRWLMALSAFMVVLGVGLLVYGVTSAHLSMYGYWLSDDDKVRVTLGAVLIVAGALGLFYSRYWPN